ncbi:hypothetical protein [Listeria seeligeri]|uniref:hypothetical protein n=1 Tax=Listeria seeligeri TaxID=1640 RepID=UPI0022EBC674|nr:hypothetical protein [Listeria seeligeri]
MIKLNGRQECVLEFLKEVTSLKESVDISTPIYTFIKHILRTTDVTELSEVQMVWCFMLNEQERTEVIQAYASWALEEIKKD